MTKTTAITAATILLMLSHAHGATIIEDTFTRSGSLNGSTTDTGQTWTGTSWTTNGSDLIVPGGSSAGKISGLTFLPNTVYVLSMDVSVTAGGFNWIGFGFTDTGGSNAASSSRGFMLHRQSPQVQLFSTGTSSAQSIAVDSSFPKTLEMTLATGATLASSSVSFKVNGSSVGVSGSTNASSIDGVFIQNISGSEGIVDNFTLIANPVPEPSTLAFVSLGALGLLLRRKPRHRA